MVEFYVKNYNPNSKQIEDFNIFSNIGFERAVKVLNGYRFNCFEDYKERVRRELLNYFRTRREYEICIGDAFSNETRKMDVYEQAIPNLDIIAQIGARLEPICE